MARGLFVGASTALTVGAVATGCGSAHSSSPLKSAIDGTKDDGTARYQVTYVEEGRAPERGVGAADFKLRRSALSLGTEPRMVWASNSLWWNTRQLTINHVVKGKYVDTRVTSPKPWITIPAAYQDRLIGPVRALDVSRIFDILGRVPTFKDVGTLTINGVVAQHYVGVLDSAEFVTILVRSDTDTLGRGHVPVRIDTWVAKDLIRRIRYQVPPADEGDPRARATFTFSDYARPVDVAPPPASKVANIIVVLARAGIPIQ